MERLEVSCECGARFRVKTSQQLKTLQCTSCHRSLTVNVAIAAQWRDRNARRSKRRSRKERMEITCQCGTRYRVRSGKEFKEFQCENCQFMVTVDVAKAAKWWAENKDQPIPEPPREKTKREKRRERRSKQVIKQKRAVHKLESRSVRDQSKPREPSTYVIEKEVRPQEIAAPSARAQQIVVHYDLHKAKVHPEFNQREWELQLDRHFRGVEGIRTLNMRLTVISASNSGLHSTVKLNIAGTIDGSRFDCTRTAVKSPWYSGHFGIVGEAVISALASASSRQMYATVRNCTAKLTVDLLKKSRLRPTKDQQSLQALWQIRIAVMVIFAILTFAITASRGAASKETNSPIFFPLYAILGVIGGTAGYYFVTLVISFLFPETFLKQDPYGQRELRSRFTDSVSTLRAKSAFFSFTSLALVALFAVWIFNQDPSQPTKVKQDPQRNSTTLPK